MFNICKCNLFHFLYANVVSLLLAKMMRISVNREPERGKEAHRIHTDNFIYVKCSINP